MLSRALFAPPELCVLLSSTMKERATAALTFASTSSSGPRHLYIGKFFFDIFDVAVNGYVLKEIRENTHLNSYELPNVWLRGGL